MVTFRHKIFTFLGTTSGSTSCIPPSLSFYSPPTFTFLSPHRFDPDHFAPGSPHTRRGAEFCPFGTNNLRKSPGYQFFYFEVTVFTSILPHHFILVPVEGQHVELNYGLVTKPKEEIYFHVRVRE